MLNVMSRYKLIACEVISSEIAACLPSTPHQIGADYVAKAAHDRPDGMRGLLQDRIDAAESGGWDAVLLGYGLCGNGTAGLHARSVPLVIPRAHDCATLFLGSRKRFQELFKDAPSTPYSSAGYAAADGQVARTGEADRFGPAAGPTLEALIAKYGEEDARELWAELHPAATGRGDDRMVYIAVPETDQPESFARCALAAAREGRSCDIVPGDLGLIRRLLAGGWNDGEFLVVPPGGTIAAAWDWDRVVKLEASDVPARNTLGVAAPSRTADPGQ